MLMRVNFVSIPVADQDRALAFYLDKLGFSVHTDAPYDGTTRWIFLRIPGAETLLHFAAPDEIRVKSGSPALCLVCDDVDAEAARLAAAGAQPHAGPADAPWDAAVRWAMLRDTEDNLILLQSSPHDQPRTREGA
ncbi:MAG: VOC family protein [Roseivivax sp.]|nr:VOC family protein [Roseivivax sp.]